MWVLWLYLSPGSEFIHVTQTRMMCESIAREVIAMRSTVVSGDTPQYRCFRVEERR